MCMQYLIPTTYGLLQVHVLHNHLLAVHTTLCPDAVLFSTEGKKIIFVELTVPWEEGCEEAFDKKSASYTALFLYCRDKGGQTWLCPIEVGGRCPIKLEVANSSWKNSKWEKVVRRLAEVAERASCWNEAGGRRKTDSQDGMSSGHYCWPASRSVLWLRAETPSECW